MVLRSPVILLIQMFIPSPSGYWGASSDIAQMGRKNPTTSAAEIIMIVIFDLVFMINSFNSANPCGAGMKQPKKVLDDGRDCFVAPLLAIIFFQLFLIFTCTCTKFYLNVCIFGRHSYISLHFLVQCRTKIGAIKRIYGCFFWNPF